MTNLQISSMQENGEKDILIKKRDTDSTKKLIAKNFINEYMYKDRSSIVKLSDAYDKYKSILKQFGCTKLIELSGFVQLFKSEGYKIDKINSIFYSPSIIGIGFKNNAHIEPIKIFNKIKLANLQKYGLSFVNDIKGNKLLLTLNADAYINGVRNGKDFERFNIENINKENSDENKNISMINTADIEDFITQETVDIQDTPIENENTDNIVKEENKSIQIPNDNLKEKDFEIQMYKNLIKSKIKHTLAEQEYQFELYEFKLYKLKLLEKRLDSNTIDEKTLETLLENINNIK